MPARLVMLALLLPFILIAQEKAAPPATAAASAVFPLLVGNWSCEGTFSGKPATGKANFSLVEGNLELDYRLLRDGKPFFTGKGIYHPRTGKGVWIDAFGNAYVLKTSFSPDAMSTEWNDTTSIRGFSTYQVSDGVLSLTDEVNGKDGRKPFTMFQCRR